MSEQVGSAPPTGTDSVLEALQRHGIPVTREAYLGLAYGEPVPELTAEQEAELPPELQDWTRFGGAPKD